MELNLYISLAALIIGYFCVRRTHIYFAILTLAFGHIIYLIAFISLWVQVHGLIGSHGILPIGDAMRGAPAGIEKWIGNPTLLFLS